MFHTLHLREDLVDLPYEGGSHRLLISQEGPETEVFKELLNLRVEVAPFGNYTVDVDIFIIEIDHSHSGDGGR